MHCIKLEVRDIVQTLQERESPPHYFVGFPRTVSKLHRSMMKLVNYVLATVEGYSVNYETSRLSTRIHGV
jgi:hypothetical protein